jgi:flagellar basal-body rod protein FlgB
MATVISQGGFMPTNYVSQLLVDQSAPTVTLKKALDAQAMRQRAHAQNIANAETPGYKRVAVDFEDQLKSVLSSDSPAQLKRTDERHMGTDGAEALQALQATTRVEEPDPNGSGINGVDIDMEMSQMAETQLRYLTSLELLKRRYTNLKSAIRGQ